MQRGRWVIAGVVVAMFVGGGCGKGTPERARAEKPEQVVMLAHAFMRDGDAEGLWALYSAAGKAQLELALGEITAMPEAELQREFGVSRAEIDGLGGEALMARMMASPVSRVRSKGELMPSVTRVVPDGDDDATVEFTRGEATCTQRVTREGGLWKMNDDGGRCSQPARGVAPAVDGRGREAQPATVVATPVPVEAELVPAAPVAPVKAVAAPVVVREPAAPVAPAPPARAVAPPKSGPASPVDDPFGN